MLEKLGLAVMITFSLNLFLQIQEPGEREAQMRQPRPQDTGQTVLVRLFNNPIPDESTDKD